VSLKDPDKRREYDRQRKRVLREQDRDAYNEYQRDYYAENSDRIKSQVTARRKANRKIIRKYLAEVKSVACKDCGQEYPSQCMDFDHLFDKRFNVSEAASGNYSLDTIKAEIAKCEVVCSNCHRLRTHRRMNKKKHP
jgi:hypothetical protein